MQNLSNIPFYISYLSFYNQIKSLTIKYPQSILNNQKGIFIFASLSPLIFLNLSIFSYFLSKYSS